MEIIHDLSRKQFQTVADGKTAYVSYDLVDGCLNIEHTIVPREIEGRGIAAALVKAAYDYALDHDLLPAATCRYATVWLDRNPQYKNKVFSVKADSISKSLSLIYFKASYIGMCDSVS